MTHKKKETKASARSILAEGLGCCFMILALAILVLVIGLVHSNAEPLLKMIEALKK